MFTISILVLLAIAALCVITWPKSFPSIYKIVVYLMSVVVIFITLFFSLRSPIDPVNLNVDLHPWRSYILPRWWGIILVSVVFFTLSQIPFASVCKKYFRKDIIAYSTLIVISATAAAIEGSLYYCPEELQTGNEVVEMIDNFNSHS